MFRPGDVIADQFEVVRFLGQGGLAVVYLVTDRLTGEQLALKIIRPSRLEKPGARESLTREVLLAHRLRHPNIIPIYDIRQDGPQLFFTMAFIEGTNLRDVMLERGTLPMDETVAILGKVCDALEHTHATVVHRDVSPENIMVGGSSVTLLDFGSGMCLSKCMPPVPVLGKGHYAAPELRIDSVHVDARADIYPLGIMFFEMLTKRTFLEPLKQDLEWNGLPPEALALVSRTIVPLERRFKTVGEFREALGRCVAPKPVAAAAPLAVETRGPAKIAPEPVPPAPERPRPRRKPVLAYLTLLAVAAAVAVSLSRPSVATLFKHRPDDHAKHAVRQADSAPAPVFQPGWVAEEGALALTPAVRLYFAHVPPGTFAMGGKTGTGTVTLTRGYWIGAHEVTQSQWEAVMSTRPWEDQSGAVADPDAPAVNVSWKDAEAFITCLNARGFGQFRLPTEAEWEYAALAGEAPPPAVRETNAWGLCDMERDAAEWCSDWFQVSLRPKSGVATDPAGPASGLSKVVRGCSTSLCPVYGRSQQAPENRSRTVGFRICRDE
ncbi:MAG: eukaryotic-like serine/threonine-protein kinase [Candidatus Hydrogenedentes bacterium]|nr:eukaryotic-like serine/threonine-protein kinase [Candidatus Hydrogenedentota bacterium]